MRRIPLLILVLILGATACEHDPVDRSQGRHRSPSQRVTDAPSPTLPPSPVPPPPPEPGPQSGPATDTCVQGWTTPAEGSERYQQALDILHRVTRAPGPFGVVAMRYFEGPESPPAEDKGYLMLVRRWYVKAYLRPDPAWRGRFLVEGRTFGAGVTAAAPFDTSGYTSPDWTGFEYDVERPPKSYPGLPGEWAGIPYDFVKGGGGLEFPGLPAEVTGCMAGS